MQMASQLNVSSHAQGALPANRGGIPSPETAGFDFMNYLLGLQTMMSPGDLRAGNNQSLATALKKGGAGELEEQLLAQPGQKGMDPKKGTPWNPLFPAGMTSAPSPLLVKKSEGGETAPAGAPSSLVPATTQPHGVPVDVSSTLQLKANELHASPQPAPASPELDGLATSHLSATQKGNPIPQAMAGAGDPKSAVTPLPVQAPGTQSAREALKRYGETPQPDTGSRPVSASPDAKLHPTFGAAALKEESKRNSNVSLSTPGGETFDASQFNPSQMTVRTEGGVAMAAGPKAHLPASPPEVLSQVATLAQQGGGKMTFSLTPPHLGKVEIEVTARGKKVEISLRPESVEAKTALEGGLNDLKQQLQSHDLILTKSEVHIPREGGNFSSMSDGRAFQQSQGFFGDAAGGNSRRDSGGQSLNRPSDLSGNRDRNGSRAVMAPSRSGTVRDSGRVDLRI